MSAKEHCSSTCGSSDASLDEFGPTSAGKRTRYAQPGLSDLASRLHSRILQALKQLKDKMTTCSYGQPDEETQKWFLRDRKLDVDEAAQKLTDMLKWRRDFQ